MKSVLKRFWSLSGEKILMLEDKYDKSQGSPVFTVNGKYSTRGWTEWTQGFEYVLDTNLKGPYFLTQSAAKWLIEQKQSDVNFVSSIINISSISATVASTNRGEYCLSKAGISMMTKLFATRLREINIPVYEIRPGIITTEMTSSVKEKYDEMFKEGFSLQRRWGVPEDVGKAVAALVRGEFPYSTGSVFVVDGGLTIRRL